MSALPKNKIITTKLILNVFQISLLLLFVLIPNATWANTSELKKPSAFSTCMACHGAQGEGNTSLNAPVIAGQSEVYLLRQLTHFKNGLRGSHTEDTFGKQMIASVQSLDFSTEAQTLAKYIASLPTPDLATQLTGDLKNGSRYYQAKCGACHGGQAQGNEAFKAPKLSGQHVQYIQRQMMHFVNGIRGGNKEDKLGRQMAMMAKTVDEKELNDILFFISQQK